MGDTYQLLFVFALLIKSLSDRGPTLVFDHSMPKITQLFAEEYIPTCSTSAAKVDIGDIATECS